MKETSFTDGLNRILWFACKARDALEAIASEKDNGTPEPVLECAVWGLQMADGAVELTELLRDGLQDVAADLYLKDVLRDPQASDGSRS